MKKFLFLSILLASFSFASFAQKGYFPCSEYKFDTIKVGTANYKEIIGSTLSSVLKGKNTAENVTLPWAFNYAGENYTQIRICSNGWIMFGGLSATTGNNNLKSTDVSNALFPLWGNLSPETGEIRYQQNIINADTMFIVQWKNIKNNSGTGSYNFQVVLYKGSNIIEFRYGAMTGIGNYSVGINSCVPKVVIGSGTSIPDSTRFISVIGSGAGPNAKLSSSTTIANNAESAQRYAGFCLRFTPPACPSPGLCGISSLLTTSAVVNFAKSGTYTFEYKKDTAANWTTINNVTGTSYPITTLAPQTNYLVRVKNSCRDNYSFITRFTTPISTPWYENFTTNPIDPGTGLPYGMVARVSTTSANKTFQIVEDNGLQAIKITNGSENFLISPAITLKKDSLYRLSFKYRRDNTNRESKKAEITTLADTIQDINAMLLDGKQIGLNVPIWGYGSDTYLYHSVTYTASKTGNYYFALNMTETGYDLYITDLKVERAECPDIEEITVSNGATPKDIVVKLKASTKDFKIEYREAPTAQNPNPTWESKYTTTESTVITVAKNNTSYEFKAKVNNCPNASYSNVKTIASKCELSVSEIPIYETFSQSNRTPCWTFIESAYTSGSATAKMIVSAPIKKEDIPASSLLVKFKAAISGGPTERGNILVGIVTDMGNPEGSFIPADTLSAIRLSGPNHEILKGDLSSLANKTLPNVPYYALAFKEQSGNLQIQMYNLQIEKNNCANYTINNITLASSTDTELNLTWECPENAEAYKVSYKPMGDAAWTSSATVTEKKAKITGLTKATPYFISVQARCASGETFGDNNYFTTETDYIIDLSIEEENKWVEDFEKSFTFVRAATKVTQMAKYPTDTTLARDWPYLLRRTHSGGGYFEVNEAHAAANEYIYTPKVKMEPGKTYRFSFWHALVSNTTDRKIDSLQVFVTDSKASNDDGILKYAMGKDSLNTRSYKRVIIDYTNTDATTVSKCFKINCIFFNKQNGSDIAAFYAFDDFEIYECTVNPTVAKTSVINIRNGYNSSDRDVVFEVKENSTFDIRYRKKGANWSMVPTVPSSSQSSFSLSSILAENGETFDTGVYEFQIRYTEHTGQNASDWSSVQRACFSPVISKETIPFKQNFKVRQLDRFADNFNALSKIKEATQCLSMSANSRTSDSACGIFVGSKIGDPVIFIGPMIDASIFNKLYVKVSYLSPKNGKYELGFVGDTANALSSFIQLFEKNTGPYRTDSISFSGRTTGGKARVYLAFKVSGSGEYNFILNGIEIDTIKPMPFVPICKPVTSLQVTPDQINSGFNISFTSQNDSDSLLDTKLSYKSVYQDKWNTVNLEPHEGDIYGYPIYNLTKGSVYQVSVFQDCKNGVTSSSEEATAYLDCQTAAYTVPYSETFENGFPACWKTASSGSKDSILRDETMLNTKNINVFEFKNSLNNPNNQKVPSIRIGSGGPKNSCWMFSPKIEFNLTQSNLQLYFLAGLTERGKSTPAIHRNGDIGDPAADTLAIYLVKTPPTANILKDSLLKGAVLLRTYSAKTNALYKLYTEITNNGTQISIPIRSGVEPGDYYIAFNMKTDQGSGYNDLFVTNIGIAPLPRCAATMNVRTNGVQSKSANITWTSSADKESYVVHYGETGTKYEDTDSSKVTTNGVKLLNLKPLTQYQLYVGSSCTGTGASVSELSAPLTFTTADSCLKPIDPTLVSTGENFAVITWEATGQNAWQVQYNAASSGPQYKMVYSNYSIIIDTIKNLSSNTTYTATVRSVCREDDSSTWTAPVSFTTNCMSTRDLKAQDRRYSQATLKWKAIPSQTKFQIEYGEENKTMTKITVSNSNSDFSYNAPDSTATYILKDLTKATTYNVYVSGICTRDSEEILGAPSFLRFQTTSDCPSVSPVDIKIEKASSDVANVTWTADERNTSWDLEYGTKGFTQGKGIETIQGLATTSAQITGLEAGKEYELAIRSYCGTDAGNWSGKRLFLDANLLEELKAPEAKFIPNPASDYTVLSLQGIAGKVTVKIFDAQGKLLQTENVSCSGNCEKQIHLNKLAQGAYSVQILSEKFVTTQKLIVR